MGDSHLFIGFPFQFEYSGGMARQACVVIPGLRHHITQRGNNREDVFFVDGDRVAYLRLLREQCEKHGVRVLGYCLMTNHIYLVATPRGDARAEGLVEPGRGADAFSLYAEFVKKSPNSVIPAKAGIQKEHITPQPSHWIPAFAGMTRGV
jgi:REP element-mobilizing transposase RayT